MKTVAAGGVVNQSKCSNIVLYKHSLKKEGNKQEVKLMKFDPVKLSSGI